MIIGIEIVNQGELDAAGVTAALKKTRKETKMKSPTKVDSYK